MSALAGLRVVDLTRYIPGPYCTLLLGDLGADVVKVEEPPFGDPVRVMPPAIGEDSAPHAALNRNKRSIVVDIRNAEGAQIVKALARRADVFIEGYRPGALAKRGLGYESLAADNPRLVYCSLAGYGQDGPLAGRAGHDINYLALGGLLGSTAAADGRPVQSLAQLADMTGGLFATVGILAALHARERTGKGQHVDVSMHRGVLGLMTVPAARLLAGGRSVTELTGSYACYRVYRCRDGRYVSVGALEPKFWEALCRALGHSDRINRQWEKPPEQDETIALFERTFAAKDRDEWTRALAAADCCVEPVLDLGEALCHPQAAPAFVTQKVGTETLRAVAAPFELRGTPATLRRGAPGAGEHTDEILAEAGLGSEAIERLRSDGVVA